MSERSYELPPPGSPSEGLEGLSVVSAPGAPLGRLAGLNRVGTSLVLLVEAPGRTVHALPATALAVIDPGAGIARLGDGVDLGPPVPVTAPRSVGPAVVRHVPAELERLVARTTGRSQSTSPLWAAALVLVMLAGFSILPVHVVIENDLGGALRWAWVAIPIVLLAAAGAVMARAADAEGATDLSFWEKLGTIPAFLLGSSPVRRDRR